MPDPVRRLFISSSKEDSQLASRIGEELSVQGLLISTASSITTGESIQGNIEAGLRGADAFVLLLSPGSTSNATVGFELGVAQARRKPTLVLLTSAEARDLAPLSLRSLPHVVVEGLRPKAIAERVISFLGSQVSAPINLDAQKVDRAAGDADNWYQVGENLRASVEDQDQVWQPVVAAFHYDLVQPSEIDRRERYGPFAPMLELATGEVYPPPLASIASEWPAIWAALSHDARDPAVIARLADLAWETSESRRALFARAAATAYVRLSTSTWEVMARTEGLLRARELASAINDGALLDSVWNASVTMARKSIEDHTGPGVALRLIESLIEMKRPDRIVDELLSDAQGAYAGDPWIHQHILQLQQRRATRVEIKENLKDDEITVWVREAEKTTGLLRLRHLQTALALAREAGRRQLADDIRRRIHDTSVEELNLQTISAQVEIPREQVDKFISAFTDTSSWQESLVRFGSYGPPIGSIETNRASVREQMSEFPLQFLFSRVVLDSYGNPIRAITSSEDQEETALIQHETQAASVWAIFAADVLDAIANRHGTPELDSLRDFVVSDLIGIDIAELIARAMRAYWTKDFNAAAHLLSPAIEAAIREMSIQANLAVYREPRGGRPGGIRSLGDLLAAVKPLMDESWWRYLWVLLAEPLGLNLRNRIAHGLLLDATRSDAALLIHAASFIRLLSASPLEPETPQ